MMRTKLPAPRAARSPEPTLSRQIRPSWRNSAVALAAVFALGLPLQEAHALALGRVTVQSALGQPLRAEIEVPQITPDEVASLRTSLASPEAFRAAGMERSAALAELQISLQQRPNGEYFLRLASDRAVTEPFVDLILEANWASGRIVRDYTMLFDPPAATRAAPPPIAAQVTPAAPAAPATSATPSLSPSPAASVAPSAPAPAAAPAAASPPQPRADAAPATRLTVQAGQTAGRIAAASKPPTVSLDQMLVALLRANPDAFTGGNVNRLKAGAVLDLPTEAQAATLDAGQARQTVIAQSRDFAEFRRRLAERAGTSPLAGSTPSRQAGGRIEAQVQDKRPAEAAPDKLTLSKGSVEGRQPTDKSAEDQIARERSAQDASTRLAELNKNIAELNRLGAASTGAAPAPAEAAASATPAPGLAVPGTVPATTVASAAPAASAATPADPALAAPAASAPASAAVATAAKPAPAAATEPGLASFLLDNPLIPAAAGGIVALLAGLGLFRLRQRRKANPQVDSSFLESRLQPDSFFGASGGQRIDTAEGASVTGTSMVYSPSQIDAAGDVDPVAEADVYLAYGRDLQAEEILKEALRTSPQRVAIHAKLLEIYAKRRDLRAFDTLAVEAHALTQGLGPQWNHIAGLGHDLDPDNPLYEPGGESAPDSGSGFSASVAAAPISAPSPLSEPMAFDSWDETPPSTQPMAPDETDERGALEAAARGPLDLDLSAFDLELDRPPTRGAPPAALSPFALSELAPDEQVPRPDLAAPTEAAPLPPFDPYRGAPEEEAGDFPVGLPPLPPAGAPALPPLPQALMDLDLDIPSFKPPSDAPAPQALYDLSLGDGPAGNLPGASAPRSAPLASGMIDFDLSGISLDLDTPAERTGGATIAEPTWTAPSFTADLPSDLPGASAETDPLATKLALAEEFNAIGDVDGARSLAEEVRAEAVGDLRQRAERLLAELG